MRKTRFTESQIIAEIKAIEALAIEIDLNFPAQRVIRVLERIALERGYPQML